ncbi:hypothetical protein [Streptomyces sp. NPDC002676]
MTSTGTPAGIPSLPGLGTTWYRRGPRYWLRRTVNAVFLLTVLAFCCFIALSLYAGFRDELPSGARTVWDAVQVAASCAALVWGWAKGRRDIRAGLLDPPAPGEFRTRKRRETSRAAGLASAGRILLLLAAPVLPAFSAWGVGWFLASLTVREYPSEAGARRWLQEHTAGT